MINYVIDLKYGGLLVAFLMAACSNDIHVRDTPPDINLRDSSGNSGSDTGTVNAPVSDTDDFNPNGTDAHPDTGGRDTGTDWVCIPGDQGTCTCDDGQTGVRGCTIDGQWSNCVCFEDDTGASDTDADTDVDTDVDTDTDNDIDTDTDTDTDADSDGDADNDTDIDTDADSDGDSDNDTDIDTDADIDGDADTDNDTDTETETEEEIFIPPEIVCPAGTYEFNFKNIWSTAANPTLGEFTTSPEMIIIKPEQYDGTFFGAKLDVDNCEYYTTCLPYDLDRVIIQPVSPETGCVETAGSRTSSPFDLSGFTTGVTKLWIIYEGSNIVQDYYDVGWVNVNPLGAGRFTVHTDIVEDPIEYTADSQPPPLCTENSDMITLHIRWPWSDSRVTGLSGSACEDDQAGISTPPYPPVLRAVQPDGCQETLAVLERQDQICPWYRLLIPRSAWQGDLKLEYPDQTTMLFTAAIPLPTIDASTDELWLVYEGAPDDDSNPSGGTCMNWSQRPNVYHFYTSNLGPGYWDCGGAEVPDLNCTDIRPLGHSVVHFRYIWAGQKTFTYFPKPEFMPFWIVLEVNGEDVICWREADSPWFRCPVPNEHFAPGSTWRAVDKHHDPEWNTVAPREFPSELGTYWLRWTYGKPDIPETSEFEFTDYYPDGVEWAAMGAWGDDFCFSEEAVDRPPIQSDGYYPWNETHFEYGFGRSIAKWYPNWESYAAIQKLLNYLVYERYLRWKEKYIAYDSCSVGTARVKTDPPETVSEGQGYGMAIAGAIGDKELFGQLWKFVRHHLSQTDDKYCGGLMGWMWDGEDACRPLDSPCYTEGGDGCGGNTDSAFDGDVDIALGLLYAAWQWPEYTEDAVEWITKMECEVNNRYDGEWYYPTPGDTWDKNCGNFPNEPCSYTPGYNGTVNMSYYAPGFFRAFGEFLLNNLNPALYTPAERRNHHDFWFRTAETVWELTERCYDDDIHPALYNDWGTYEDPCSAMSDNYNWSRALFRMAVDVAWYGQDTALSETQDGSSQHYPTKSQMQAKMDLIQQFYALDFPPVNPPEPNANRFSTISGICSPTARPPTAIPPTITIPISWDAP